MNGRRGIVRVRQGGLDAYAAGRASPVPFTVYGVEDGMESADYSASYISPPRKDGRRPPVVRHDQGWRSSIRAGVSSRTVLHAPPVVSSSAC